MWVSATSPTGTKSGFTASGLFRALYCLLTPVSPPSTMKGAPVQKTESMLTSESVDMLDDTRYIYSNIRCVLGDG